MGSARAGLVIGVLMGLAIGGPLAILTYGSIRDAVQSGEEMNFSLDNFTTDVPPAQLAQVCVLAPRLCTRVCFVLAARLRRAFPPNPAARVTSAVTSLQKIKNDWGLARHFIWWQLLQASLVCCSVGLASGLIATLAATAAQVALSSSSLDVSDGDAIPPSAPFLHPAHDAAFLIQLCSIAAPRSQIFGTNCCPCDKSVWRDNLQPQHAHGTTCPLFHYFSLVYKAVWHG